MTKERAKIKAARYLEWAEKAEIKSKEIMGAFHSQYKDFDWTQPILRGHHSQRRHEKVFERRDSVMRKSIDLDAKAKRFREKAENLIIFSNRNKGDAENARAEKRAKADEKFVVGSEIIDWCFGKGVVKKVNKKTYTIIFSSGSVFTRDKSYFV